MSSQQHNNRLKQAPELGVNYELFEISELDRATDEATAVKIIFGPPLATATLSQRRIECVPLIIVGYDQRPIIRKLRQQRATVATALRPIAVVGISENDTSPALQQLADVVLTSRAQRDLLQTMRNQLLKISGAVRQLSPAHDDPALLLLQYLYTRAGDGEVVPRVDASARFAYRYPLAERLLSTSTAETLDVLQDLAEHELLAGKVIDRLFLCPTCSSYRVPVKELCPECQTPNVGTQDSIHHFRCGFVGPESEFISSGHPVCPKCNTELRHIGVEYNRPGRIIACQECGHWASEPNLRAWCVDCNAYYAPEQLSVVRISRFGITKSGARAAQTGRWNPYQAQLIPPNADAAAHPDNTGEYERARGIARSLVDAASTNQWPMKVYRVEITTPMDDALSSRLQNDQIRATEHHIKSHLGGKTLVTQLNRENFLAFAVNDRRKGTLSPSALEKKINAQSELHVRIAALAPSAAAELLSHRA